MNKLRRATTQLFHRGGNSSSPSSPTSHRPRSQTNMPPTAVDPTGEQISTSTKFTWKITNFTRLTGRKYYSMAFTIDGAKWRILIFPKGNNTDSLSVYMDFAESASQPAGWSKHAKFSIILVNQSSSSNSKRKETEHTFTSREADWGFTNMIPLNELRNTSNGFLVNDAVIIEAEFVISELEPEGEQLRMSDKFTWKLTNFTRLTARKCYSQIFCIGGTDWRLLFYPEGNGTSHLSVYLEVANHSTLPEGWTRSTAFSINLVNQVNRDDSIIKGTQNEFNSNRVDWGFTTMISLSDLRDTTKGFLVNDTLIMEVEFDLPETETGETNPPPVQPNTDTFDSYFTSLEQFIAEAEISLGKVGTSLHDQAAVMTFEAPGIEEINNAKQSLKECLSDLFKLNMRDRLAEALSTLSRAQTGLSTEQQNAIRAFQSNFSEFTSDFLIFEQDNSEFELQKVTKDQMFSAMKKSHQEHLSNKKLSEELEREEEELKRKLEEVKSRREKLVSDWEVLMTESEEAKSRYKIQEKKVAEAEEKKRVAEERMSRSTTAWSNLKAHFT
ncbi:hypothetical protein MLD38_026039 [Melastoma candidum]|uniref:Uncharacterized protein n=1 Tax=Melastoma candidum TaxID=119954 RepID=A0ACB9NXS1_9MYRT|nr:hypothetical protein MLD38_026039 [Melastoma candidum]